MAVNFYINTYIHTSLFNNAGWGIGKTEVLMWTCLGTTTKYIPLKFKIRSTRHRCSLDYQPLKCRTSLFQRSYFNRTVKLWNSLSSSIRTLPSVNAFKAALVRHYKKALVETFDQDNVYTWKSLCPKCYSIRNLSSFRQCCF